MSKQDDIFNNRYDYVNQRQNSRKQASNQPKQKKKWSKMKKALVITLTCLLCIIALVVGAVFYMFGGLTRIHIDKSNSALGIDDAYKYLNSGVTNIALFGIDASSNNTNRSDTIMVISIDGTKKTVKVSSLLRDSYVAIDLPNGNTIHEKITHAYHYGGVYQNEGYKTNGPQLAIRTINQNFNLDIKDFVAVNFEEAAEVVDYLGGIDIEITEAERRSMNRMDYNKLVENDNAVEESGMVHLNGMQACQYARIRDIDSDNERSNRQGKVLELLLEKVKDLGVTQYPGFIKAMMNIVHTSLEYTTILGFTTLISPDLHLQRMSFPQTTDPDKPYYMAEGSEVIGGMYEGAWVWRYDLEEVSGYMHDFIYESDSLSDTSSVAAE